MTQVVAGAVVAPVIVPGSAEHDAAMIALAESSGVRLNGVDVEKPTDAATAAAAAAAAASADLPIRPANVPEKFWNKEKGAINTDALLESYVNLEKVKAAPAEAAKPAAPSAEAKAATEATAAVTTAQAAVVAAKAKAAAPEATDADKAAVATAEAAVTAATAAAEAAKAKAAAADAVPSMDAVLKTADAEFTADGKLSDATYAALAKNGISKEYADSYIAGLTAQNTLTEAQAQKDVAKVYDVAGGQEEYTKTIQWAAVNLTKAEIEAFDNTLTGGDINAAVLAATALRAKYVASHGTEPTTRIVPANNAGKGGEKFANGAEMHAAMSDPRYRSGDKAFHAEVDRKLAGSIAAGIELGIR